MSQFTRPTLVTITAPTCSGKSTLLDALTNSGEFSRIVSTTTRGPRPGEREGVDYDYISMKESYRLEQDGKFFELIEFNKVRYGVTHAQMETAMRCDAAPVVVLEPKGLAIYEQKCHEHGWDIFKIYVHTTESVCLERLLKRSVIDLESNPQSKSAGIVAEHQRRLLSITGDERRWQNATNWDVIVTGEDIEKAHADINVGIKWRNRKVATPKAYTHEPLAA